MSSSDLRKRPWRVLRVVVEVTVPPTSRANERDLQHLVEDALPRTMRLPRPIHDDAREAVVRTKTFTGFWPAFLHKERGLKIITKLSKVKDATK